jgi:tRNA pseudouridine55 synthase
VQDADPERVLPLGDALAFLPTVRLSSDAARRAGHGVAVPGEAHGAEFVLLADEDGPIAVAEPRPGAELKPVVGFRG